jgi:hypothetical protein
MDDRPSAPQSPAWSPAAGGPHRRRTGAPDVPESKSRKKATYTPPPAKSTGPKANAPWFLPVMLGLMILGLVWIVVTYLTQSQYPIPGINQWNLLIGFVFIIAGFGMTTRWR